MIQKEEKMHKTFYKQVLEVKKIKKTRKCPEKYRIQRAHGVQ